MLKSQDQASSLGFSFVSIGCFLKFAFGINSLSPPKTIVFGTARLSTNSFSHMSLWECAACAVDQSRAFNCPTGTNKVYLNLTKSENAKAVRAAVQLKMWEWMMRCWCDSRKSHNQHLQWTFNYPWKTYFLQTNTAVLFVCFCFAFLLEVKSFLISLLGNVRLHVFCVNYESVLTGNIHFNWT